MPLGDYDLFAQSQSGYFIVVVTGLGKTIHAIVMSSSLEHR